MGSRWDHANECDRLATDMEGLYYALRTGGVELPPALRFTLLQGAARLAGMLADSTYEWPEPIWPPE